MKIFPTFQEVINYIPNCVICHKEMKISIEGYVSAVDKNKPKWGSGSSRVYLKMLLKDGILSCAYKSNTVVIEAATNKVIEGEDLVNRLMLQTITVKKCCPTCIFRFYFVYQAGNVKKTHNFPPLILQREELNYTMPGGKHCLVTKHYHFQTPDEETKCNVAVNNISLLPVALDFSKLTDLEQINKKIKTITVFQ